MKKELDYLGEALGNPKRPFVAVIGGSKVSGKIDVIKNLLPRVDKLLIGGGMTYTFLKAQGLEVGKSIVENDKIELAQEPDGRGGRQAGARDGLRRDRQAGLQGRAPWARLKTVARDAIPADWEAVDAGPDTVAAFTKILLGAKTIVLERPGGRVRDRRHREGDDRDRRGAGQGDRGAARPPSSAAATRRRR